jgi:hypothetical protein
MLLDAHVDVNTPDAEGWTALHYAAAISPQGEIAVVSILLYAQALVDAVTADRSTVLIEAVSNGQPAVLQLLLD